MKEAIGGTWIFAICITFIILFTGYLAISVNYSKAFKLKSAIVNEIEEAEEVDEEKIKTYLTAQAYTAYGDCPSLKGDSSWDDPIKINLAPRTDGKANVCIYKLDATTQNDEICNQKSYYKVVTFFKFDLPILNVVLTFKVSGDTAYIYEGNSVGC